MEKSQKCCLTFLILALTIFGGLAGFLIGEQRGAASVEESVVQQANQLKVATDTVAQQSARLNDLIDELALTPPDHFTVLSGITTCFMSEYGGEPLGSIELSKDTVYRFRLDIPKDCFEYSLSSYSGAHLRMEDNRIGVRFFYPRTIKAGENGKLVALIKINDRTDTLVASLDFTALDDLSLIYGNSSTEYSSAGGDLSFRDGTIEIRFYTGATKDFNHPTHDGTHGNNYIYCDSYAY